MKSAASATAPTERALYDAFIKGDPAIEQLEPCPICQTALLILDEKGLPFNRQYVDSRSRPDWLKAVAGDEMPVIKDLDTDPQRWYVGLPDISRHLQERHPETSIGVIGTAARPGTGQATQANVDGLWAAFLSYLEAAQGDDEEELRALEDMLRDVKQKLADKRYLQGDADVTAADLALVPRLHHIMTSLPELKMRPVAESAYFLLEKNWQMPDDMEAVEEYVDRVRNRDSFRKSTTPSEAIVAHWRDHQSRNRKKYRKRHGGSKKRTDIPVT
ncbi:g10197 [Coccomyxa elongata]